MDHFEVDDLREEKVKELDRIVEKLNMDKYRAWYFNRSRLNDQT